VLISPPRANALRSGRVRLRGGVGKVDRLHRPVLFWSSIAVMSAVFFLGVGMALQALWSSLLSR
jgi:hypothetical protein